MIWDYLNKISLFVFVITAGALIFEIRAFLKESKKKKINLPGFSEKEYEKQPLPKATPIKIEINKPSPSKVNIKLTLALVGVLFVVGGFSVFILNTAQFSAAKEERLPIKKIVESKGIVVFDSRWRELDDAQISQLKPGDKVFIGVYKPPLSDIDYARIRVNSSSWSDKNVTKMFNKDKGVFYIEYTISNNEPKLVIEAQLHSKNSGWLGNQ